VQNVGNPTRYRHANQILEDSGHRQLENSQLAVRQAPPYARVVLWASLARSIAQGVDRPTYRKSCTVRAQALLAGIKSLFSKSAFQPYVIDTFRISSFDLKQVENVPEKWAKNANWNDLLNDL
jgi:hypothetical protein